MTVVNSLLAQRGGELFTLCGNHSWCNHTSQGEVQAADNIPLNNPVSHISGMLSMHLIYDIKHDNQTWNKKPFSQSRGHMYQNDRDWRL